MLGYGYGIAFFIIGYLLLVGLVLLFIIKRPRSLFVNLAIIPLSLLYGISLYTTLPNLLGWSAEEHPGEGAYLITYFISSGYAYIITSTDIVEKNFEPRMYKVLATKKTKENLQATEKARKEGRLSRVRKGKPRNFMKIGNQWEKEEPVEFEIVDPTTILKKDENG